mgnify:CR=1 FL=1
MFSSKQFENVKYARDAVLLKLILNTVTLAIDDNCHKQSYWKITSDKSTQDVSIIIKCCF